MAWGALLHELCEDPRLVGGPPVVSHLIEDEISHGSAHPEGDYPLLIRLPGLGRAHKGYLLSAVQQVEIVKRMAAKLGIGGRGLGRGPAFAHYQLAPSNTYGLVLHKVLESAGSPQHGRGCAITCTELSDELSPLRRNVGDRLKALMAQLTDTGVH